MDVKTLTIMPWVKYTTKVKSVTDFSASSGDKTFFPDASGSVTFNRNMAAGSVMQVDYDINAPTNKAYEIEYSCSDNNGKTYKDAAQPSPVKGKVPSGSSDSKTINISIN